MTYDWQWNAVWHLNRRIKAAKAAEEKAWAWWAECRSHEAQFALDAAIAHMDRLYSKLSKVNVSWDTIPADEQERLNEGDF